MNDLLKKIHEELEINENHISHCKLEFSKEPPLSDLEIVEIDYEGKPFILAKTTAKAWSEMKRSAEKELVRIDPLSGFRSYLYQKQLIARQIKMGNSLEVVLTQIAIPGFSEHHTGRAIDICTDGKYIFTQEFENTKAYEWLSRNAEKFGFRLSYPRDNQMGIVFEPWHWYFVG